MPHKPPVGHALQQLPGLLNAMAFDAPNGPVEPVAIAPAKCRFDHESLPVVLRVEVHPVENFALALAVDSVDGATK